MSDPLGDLRSTLGSSLVIGPADDAYAKATSPDNSSYPQQPVAVVRPHDAGDVAAVVRAAASAGLKVAAQATGHGAAQPIGDDTVLLDLAALDALTVDTGARTARMGGGVRWGKVQEQAFAGGLLGLAGTSATVGVAGYTVNGGVGWQVRPHGLASASLRAVEYVDGSGIVRRTDCAAADPDALWAFRGGAPLGIVTELEVDLFPVPELWVGYLLWPGEHLPELAAAWLRCLEDAPPGLTSTLAQLSVPSDGPFPKELLGTVVTHLSYASVDGEAGLADMRAALIRAAPPATDTTGPGDPSSLAGIHLDPPVAVPGRGIGEWLGPVTPGDVTSIFTSASLGREDGLNMIELRHVAPAGGRDEVVHGALTKVPGPFLLHAVGGGPDDAARASADNALAKVEQAAAPVSTGRSAPGFREGQPGTGPAYPAVVLDRLLGAMARNDPQRVLSFHRVATPHSRST